MVSYILTFRWQPSCAQRPEAKLLQLKPKERKLGPNILPFNRIFRLGFLTPHFEVLVLILCKQAYRARLAVAGAMHAFQRDTDDTLARIKEKILLLDSTDRGKDLKDVQELTKKAEGVAEFLAGTHKRIEEHHAVAADLSK